VCGESEWESTPPTQLSDRVCTRSAGAKTSGGAGGNIAVVTTLDDDGPGSLRQALAQPGPTVVEFSVAGVIALKSELVITHSYVTVDGETAPSPGVTLIGASLRIKTHNVIVRHLRIRVGDAPGDRPEDRDAISIVSDANGSLPIHDVLIEYCSMSWALDETISTWFPNVRNITIRNSIIAEGLAYSIHPDGRHSYGLLLGKHSEGILVQENLFAHNTFRNPVIDGGAHAVVVNNLIYNSINAVHFYEKPGAGPAIASLVGNVVWAGVDTSMTSPMTLGTLNPDTQIYLDANLDRDVDAFSTTGDDFANLGFDPLVSEPPIWPEGMVALDASDVPAHVTSTAGARPWDRDATDLRIISEVNNATGATVSIPNQSEWSDLIAGTHMATPSAATTPILSVTGTCPGQLTIAGSDFTPRGGLMLFAALQPGSVELPPALHCAGHTIDLTDPALLTSLYGNAAGSQSIVIDAPAVICGAYLQALDPHSCGKSSVVMIP